ncbi:hypothetical protein K2173_020685 [Erythroxylum novogranatense]|uniref:Uncharacterized protein n=1 Tax=Erythroxylum novogranatense TaxID=1862640 RepID=A0AAV8TP53_9ROSI|nr:hypothetical protein K2173_020685 [Erythroxylum novogranatense]
MKRTKGVVPAMESSLSPYAPPLNGDARTRFKHQSLMQDFEELYKETEAKKFKLQMTREKKLTLLDEVRFLRRRYKYLSENQDPNPPVKRNSGQPRQLVTGSKSSRREAALRKSVPQLDSKRKQKFRNEPASIPELKQKQKTHSRKETASRISSAIPDLNQKERIYAGKEAACRTSAPIFDLNEISMEEEELQASCGMIRIDESEMISMRSGNDEQLNDMKLAACRNLGNGSSHAGKRRISWMDPVALRV